MKLSVKKLGTLLAGLGFLGWVGWSIFFVRPEGLQIHFFDVGQGDAILITTEEGEHVLIDGGPDETILTKLAEQLGFFEREIDAVVLTHPHADHLAGLNEVLKRYQVKKIYSTGVLHTSNTFIAWLQQIKEKQIPFQLVKAGDLIPINEASLEVLYPFETLSPERVENLNETSVVLMLDYHGVKVLLTGDIEEEGELALINSGVDISANILKIAHHGSDSSTSQEFLEKVNPVLAMISVGKKNRFGHPSGRVIKRLGQANIKIWRTDLNGDLHIVIFEKGWRVLR